ncbi:MAG: hypothetical protein ICV70_06715 [Jiangellaceae bacterium]|nr:hypothetical protein [Jiangellaceae bacterium]
MTIVHDYLATELFQERAARRRAEAASARLAASLARPRRRPFVRPAQRPRAARWPRIRIPASP